MDGTTRGRSKFHSALKLVVAALIGLVIGMGVFGVRYSEATSYLSSNPQTCTNCHVMQPQYDAWARGPHRNVATCDDCHLPHGNLIQKYYVQLSDGVLHGYKYTTNSYPTHIVIRDSSLQVVNGACLSCHGTMVSGMHTPLKEGETITCTHCHQNVGHDS